MREKGKRSAGAVLPPACTCAETLALPEPEKDGPSIWACRLDMTWPWKCAGGEYHKAS
ncbi:MAG: hypothetical protein Q4C45_04520 [Oscillospiraceae bacterium]|nr:hypothetical protein [Oscillospiraceae bacterium]